MLRSIFTCDDLHAKSKEGKCGRTPNEAQRVVFSLYFAYSADVLTDLMGMVSCQEWLFVHYSTTG